MFTPKRAFIELAEEYKKIECINEHRIRVAEEELERVKNLIPSIRAEILYEHIASESKFYKICILIFCYKLYGSYTTLKVKYISFNGEPIDKFVDSSFIKELDSREVALLIKHFRCDRNFHVIENIDNKNICIKNYE